jgi:hypothetical protein
VLPAVAPPPQLATGWQQQSTAPKQQASQDSGIDAEAGSSGPPFATGWPDLKPEPVALKQYIGSEFVKMNGNNEEDKASLVE